MDKKTLGALLCLLDLMVQEIEMDDLENTLIEALTREAASDPAISQALLTLAKRTYKILSPHVDADRIGELVLESKLDPAYFDEHLAEH